MASGLDWDRIQYVVELGPGSGAFTEAIHARMKPGTHALAIELEPTYIATLRQQYSPQIEVVQGSATQIEAFVRERGWPRVDAVFSGLPFNVPEPVREELHPALLKLAAQGTSVRCFTYFPGPMKRAYFRFQCKRIQFVPRNFPPMWIYELRSPSQ
mgnify:CR=1 FL=1